MASAAHQVRLIREEELPKLLALYRHLLAVDAPVPPAEELARLWKRICANPDLAYVVVEVGGELVSSCTLAIIDNLTRGGRPYAVIENVVTHADYRCRGLATAALHYAVGLARDRCCYKVMLMTGSKRPETLRFYEKAGFAAGAKTAFVMRLE